MQTPPPDTGLTQRPYSAQVARPQRTHGALDGPTALSQRPRLAR